MSTLTTKQREFLNTYINDHNGLAGRRKENAANDFARRKGAVQNELDKLPPWEARDLRAELDLADEEADDGRFKTAYKRLKEVKKSVYERTANYKPMTDISRLGKELTVLLKEAPTALAKYEECEQYRKSPEPNPENAPSPQVLMDFLAQAKLKLARILQQAKELEPTCRNTSESVQLAKIGEFVEKALTGKFKPLAASPTRFCSVKEMERKLALGPGAGESVNQELERDEEMELATETPNREVRLLQRFEPEELSKALPELNTPENLKDNDPYMEEAKRQLKEELPKFLQNKGAKSDYLFDLSIRSKTDLAGAYAKARGWNAKQDQFGQWNLKGLTKGQLKIARLVASETLTATRDMNPCKTGDTKKTLALNGMDIEVYETVTIDGEVYENPEPLAAGGMGCVTKYTSKDDPSKTIVVKQALGNNAFGRKTMANELLNNRHLLNGDEKAEGRQNLLEMKGSMQDGDGNLLMVMDLAAGDLDTVKYSLNAASSNNLMSEEARSVLNQYMLKQALQGMKYLRDENVVHRDLKEPNFMVMEDGTVKVADLGTSLISEKETGGTKPSWEGTSAGYRAPEQDRAKGMEVDSGGDMYAVGKMGQMMQRGDKFAPSLNNVNLEVEGLTGTLGRLTKQMTSEDPKDRPTIEGVLESGYLKNLDNYREEDIKELVAASIAYGKALDTRKIKAIDLEMRKIRSEIAELEKSMKVENLPNNEKEQLLGQWQEKRKSLATEQEKMFKLQNTPKALEAAQKVKEISQRLTRPPEQVTEEGVNTFIKQLASASQDAGQFSSFVALPSLVELFRFTGVEQKDIVGATKLFEMVLDEDKEWARQKLDKAVRDVATLLQKVKNSGVSLALKDGYNNILQSLAWQFEQKFKEAYAL